MKQLWLIPLLMLTGCANSVRLLPTLAEKLKFWTFAEKKVEETPTAENHVLLGIAEEALGHHEAAIKHFEAASALNPSAAVADLHLCMENNVLGRWAEAIRRCERVLASEPDHALAKNGLRFAQRGVSSSMDDGLGQINLGMESYSKNDWPRAISVWEKISKKSPFYAMSRSNIASAYILQKKFGPARKAIDESLKIEPNNELFKNNLNWLNQEVAKKN